MVAAHGREKSSENASRALALTAILLTVFTMFFVWSCTLTLGADGLAEAREQNLPVLSYLANETQTPFLAWVSPVIAICAIITSYFGHLLGTEEGTSYLVRVAAPRTAAKLNPRATRRLVLTFVFVTAILAAVANPSILDMISVVGGIFMAFLPVSYTHLTLPTNREV